MVQPNTPVKSVQTLLRILNYMRGREGVTVTGAAEELDLAPSTVHKHLATVKGERFVVQEGDEYRLGLGFFTYGMEIRGLFSIYELATDSIEELAAETGERVWLKVEEQGVEIPIDVATGDHAIITDRALGVPNKMHRTSGGKAILAFLPTERRDAIIADTDLTPRTEHTITDEDRLREELERVRTEGIAYNIGEDIKSVNAVGAPIIDNDGVVHGSIVIAGPENRMTRPKLRGEFTELVSGTTDELGINISYQK